MPDARMPGLRVRKVLEILGGEGMKNGQAEQDGTNHLDQGGDDIYLPAGGII